MLSDEIWVKRHISPIFFYQSYFFNSDEEDTQILSATHFSRFTFKKQMTFTVTLY